ncbi:pilus assembly protein CpaF [Granulicella rosea]|uniref:Pilus assembly protein CpaF n=1 Tax=Granulicella rosea TaxID=474952 RepID=A0A239JD37_9BACT|nr:ATPase, T2SS/T4P/T4SS family [Granulicella rosea]SNT03183.1 pilus assembly protein CpaF [Granulicella rosea]
MNHDLDLLISFLQPIKELLLDDSVSEIMGNPNGQWWFERRGKLEHADIIFDAKALRTGLEVIANKLSRKLDEAHPLLNAQLPDGSRLAAVLPPVVRPNPAVTIRKFSKTRFTIADLIQTGAMAPEIGATLSGYIEAGKTMLISGGTGAGKTSLLNALADYIPEEERIVVIEDTSELRIGKPNLLASECQTESHTGTVSFNDLLKAALRWRPDRIILGEVRGEEARTLLDSFNTGHAGSMATIHASSAVKALRRFGELAMRSHQQSNRDDISAEIAETVQIVAQVGRFASGRKVSEIIAVHGYDRTTKQFMYDTIFDLAGERDVPAIHPIISTSNKRENVHAIA